MGLDSFKINESFNSKILELIYKFFSLKDSIVYTQTYKKYFFKYTMTWSEKVENILKRWRTSIYNRKLLHIHQMKRYKRLHWSFLIPSSAIGAIVGAGLVSIISVDNSSTIQMDGRCVESNPDIGAKIFLALLSITSTILNSVSAAVGFNDIYQNHKDAVDSYDSLDRIIDTTLHLPDSLRGNPLETLQTIRELYDRCVEKAPRSTSDENYELDGFISEESISNDKNVRKISKDTRKESIYFNLISNDITSKEIAISKLDARISPPELDARISSDENDAVVIKTIKTNSTVMDAKELNNAMLFEISRFNTIT